MPEYGHEMDEASRKIDVYIDQMMQDLWMETRLVADATGADIFDVEEHASSKIISIARVLDR